MNDEMLDDVIAHDKEYKYAGFWIRFGAAIIDGLILLPFSLLYLLILFGVNVFAISLFGALISMLYKPFMEIKYGATVGKMALGIKVIQTNGEHISTIDGFKRFLLPWAYSSILSIVSLFFLHQSLNGSEQFTFMSLAAKMQETNGLSSLSQIGSLLSVIFGLSIALDKQKRGLHDKIAGTMVVYKE